MREDAENLTKSSRVEQKEQLELAPPPVVLPSHVPPGAMRTPLGVGPGSLLWLGEESKGTLGSCRVQPAQQGQTRPLQADPMTCSGPGWPQSPAGGHQLQLPTSTAWGQQEPTLETSVLQEAPGGKSPNPQSPLHLLEGGEDLPQRDTCGEAQRELEGIQSPTGVGMKPRDQPSVPAGVHLG